MSSCTKHYAAATTAAAPAAAAPAVGEKPAEPVAPPAAVQADTTSGPGLRDSLIGTWKLRLVELDDAANTMNAYGSQTERDQMLQRQKQFQDAIRGLISVFRADSTYSSAYAGQKETGRWRVTRRRGFDTFSDLDGTTGSYTVRSVTSSTLVVFMEASDIRIMLTLDRQ